MNQKCTLAMTLGAERGDIRWDLDRGFWKPVDIANEAAELATPAGGQATLPAPETNTQQESARIEANETPREEVSTVQARSATIVHLEHNKETIELQEADRERQYRWVMKDHFEIACAVSFCCRVMAKPSEEAWNCCMQIIAWLRDHKDIGIKFRSDATQHGLVATSDASNRKDPKDHKCQGSHTIQWYGGPLAHLSKKLPRIGAGSPANEFMALRIAAARVMKFRHLFKELGLYEVITEPTKIYCDNKPAISWEKTGQITEGNHYFDIDFHQPREWERLGHIEVFDLDTRDMITDLGTKAVGEPEIQNLLLVLKGHEPWTIKHPRRTLQFT